MIPIPSIPTDNLYKFMTLCGALLTVAPTTLVLALANGHVDWYSDALNEIDIRHSRLEEQLLGIEDQSKFDQMKKKLDDKREEEKKRAKELDVMRAGIWREEFKIAQGTPYLGFLLMAFGFGAWYLQHQKIQDQILKIDLEKAQIELSKLKQ